jgi:hypothetical protein
MELPYTPLMLCVAALLCGAVSTVLVYNTALLCLRAIAATEPVASGSATGMTSFCDELH